MTRQYPLLAICLIAQFTLGFASDAHAHATVDMLGTEAGAGQAGTLTVRIPHGCVGGLATDKIVITLDPKWGLVAPENISGWQTFSSRDDKGTWTISWTALDTPLPFNQSHDFPMHVIWPKVPGTYAVPTTQICGGVTNAWDDPYLGPATGAITSPVSFPLPRVLVKPRPLAGK